jgi:hypothetical protein
MRTRARTSALVAVALLCTAGVSGAAIRECHPDPPGTRTLMVAGALTHYGFANGGVVVSWARSADCAGTAAWDFRKTATAKASNACGEATPAAARPLSRLAAADGATAVRVRLAPPNVDRPDRLEVVDRTSGNTVASWPLIARPARVDLYDDLAVLSGARRQGLYVVDVNDGRIAMLGITQPRDRPVIGAAGLLYQNAVEVARDKDAQGRWLPPMQRTVGLKLVPLATVRSELARVGREQVTRPIRSFSMDGPRVAYAVADPSGACDQLRFWNIPWHFTSVLTKPTEATCLPGHAPGGITSVAIAGSRAIWTTRYGTTTRVLAGSIIDCQEWVVARPAAGSEHVAALAGDGGVLAYAFATRQKRSLSTVGIVPRFWRGIPIVRAPARPLALSADNGRLATLRENGTVTLTTGVGTLGRSVRVGQARAIALRGNTLAVLSSRGTLDVYGANSGRLLRSISAPRGARSLDLHYGIALVTGGRDAYAVNVMTGRTAHLLHAPGRVAAQLEAPGAVLQFNAGGSGHLRFLPMSRLEASTR